MLQRVACDVCRLGRGQGRGRARSWVAGVGEERAFLLVAATASVAHKAADVEMHAPDVVERVPPPRKFSPALLVQALEDGLAIHFAFAEKRQRLRVGLVARLEWREVIVTFARRARRLRSLLLAVSGI